MNSANHNATEDRIDNHFLDRKLVSICHIKYHKIWLMSIHTVVPFPQLYATQYLSLATPKIHGEWAVVDNIIWTQVGQ